MQSRLTVGCCVQGVMLLQVLQPVFLGCILGFYSIPVLLACQEVNG